MCQWPPSDGARDLCRSLTHQRRALGLSQAEIEARMGCGSGCLAEIEIGSRMPSLAFTCDWARALGTKLRSVDIAPGEETGSMPAPQPCPAISLPRALPHRVFR